MSRSSKVAHKAGQVIRFLVELDALLDTRLGLIDTLDPEAAVRLVSGIDYFQRSTESYEKSCGISDTVFKEAWAKRNKETLKHSLQTGLIHLLHCRVVEAERLSVSDPLIAGAHVEVTTYPYVLDEAEEYALAEAIAMCVGVHAPIELTHQPLAYYTPALLKKNYTFAFLYNHNEWLKAHANALNGGERAPSVTMYAPMLAYHSLPPAEISDYKGYGITAPVDPFEATSYALKEAINLEFVPVHFYCAVWPGINGVPPINNETLSKANTAPEGTMCADLGEPSPEPIQEATGVSNWVDDIPSDSDE